MPRKKAPELTFQKHIAAYLVREHGYGVLEQTDITDTAHFIAEQNLWAFLQATQADTLNKLAEDYGTDARDEVFRALRKELERTPLWMILRHGLPVRGLEFRLFYPKPRSAESAGTEKYPENRITFRPHFYFGAVEPGQAQKEIDFVFLLNGLPIVALEVKHEANQNVHDAVAQFAARDHKHRIFQHPFLYLAADTSDVMAATDPRRVENFRWHNTGLKNEPLTNPNEYPVEFLYREVLSKEQLLEALSFFLVRVPKRDAEGDKQARPAFTMFPRYHQSRLVRKLSADILAHFAATGDIGKKYLADHSAGSGKTLSICWLADRLHSLYKPGTNEKLVDITFILTDRKSLDTNIREDMANFTHLNNVVGIARKAEDLPRFLRERKPIIVTTQQKLAWVLDELQNKPELKSLRVAFLMMKPTGRRKPRWARPSGCRSASRPTRTRIRRKRISRKRSPRSSVNTTSISCSSRSLPRRHRTPSACSARRSTATPRRKRLPKGISWMWRRASFPTRRSTTCTAISCRQRTRRRKSIRKASSPRR